MQIQDGAFGTKSFDGEALKTLAVRPTSIQLSTDSTAQLLSLVLIVLRRYRSQAPPTAWSVCYRAGGGETERH